MAKGFVFDPPPAEPSINSSDEYSQELTPPIFTDELVADGNAFVGPSMTLRLDKQGYHPIVFIGSSASGKSALLLSLLAFFKDSSDLGMSVFFGTDLFRPDESDAHAESLRFFNKTLSEFVYGETAAATRIGSPMFIPVRIGGGGQHNGIKFAFLESEGEWYQPDPNSKTYYKPFRPEIEDLLSQYADGITFVWVAPYAAANAVTGAYAPQVDPYQQVKVANESLEGALQNYEALRSHNSEKDSHIFLVTKWDTFRSQESPEISPLLRDDEQAMRTEIDKFIAANYRSAYSTFKSIPGAANLKKTFRYSAGAFRSRTALPMATPKEVLLGYPRDLWNWIYDGAITAHPSWSLNPGPLIPVPQAPKLGIYERFLKWLEDTL